MDNLIVYIRRTEAAVAVEIMAEDEHGARAKIEAKYPEDKGFVIENVSVSQDPS